MFEILADCDTPLGFLCLRRRELLSRPGTVVTEVTLDHILLMSSLNTVSERALARQALELHPGRDLKVLVGGFGLGYTAQEALASERVSRVEVIELLPEVLRWFEEDLIPLSSALKGEPRLAVRQGDIFELLLGPAAATYDVLLIDIDHAPEEVLQPAHQAFYEQRSLEAVARHLAPDGVLGVWSAFEDEPFLAALEAVFGAAHREPIRWWNELVDEETEESIFLAHKR